MHKIASRSLIPLLILFFVGVTMPEVQAQRLGRGAAPALRIKSKRVLRRTAVVLFAAQKDLKAGKVFTGNFAKAIRHQRYARFLWRRGFYVRAIHHSRRARMLALSVISANKGAVKAEYNFDKEEDILMKNAPSDTSLETELTGDKDFQSAYPNQSANDEDFLNMVIDDIDLTDLD